jgi:hypothetical protein
MSGDYKLANIVRTVLTTSNTSNPVAFLTGTCECHQNKTGVPKTFSGTPEFVWQRCCAAPQVELS